MNILIKSIFLIWETGSNQTVESVHWIIGLFLYKDVVRISSNRIAARSTSGLRWKQPACVKLRPPAGGNSNSHVDSVSIRRKRKICQHACGIRGNYSGSMIWLCVLASICWSTHRWLAWRNRPFRTESPNRP